MNIKEKIGQRIEEQRKAQGLTRRALAELTYDLKPSRINNWENGIRTPGPQEIKQLAKVLDVSAAFLMCLSDEKQSNKTPGIGKLIPLLNHEQACDPKIYIQSIKDEENKVEPIFIPVSTESGVHLGEYAFALKMIDDSMDPELRRNDILIIDPNKPANPGSFVAAKVGDSNEVVVRRYKQLSATHNIQKFELLVLNTHWADIRDSAEIILIGTICGLNRSLG